MEKAKQATPHKTLLAELMDSNVPKSEREHAAVREIEKLQEEIERLQAIDRQGKALARERFALVEENITLKKDSEVAIFCSIEQLRVIQFALEFYSRIGIMQLEEILNHCSIDKILINKTTPDQTLDVGVKCLQGEIVKIEGDKVHCEGVWGGDKEVRIFNIDEVKVSPNWSDYHAIKDEVRSLLLVVKNLISKIQLRNGSYGIHSKEADESCRTAFDMMQVIRHEFWKNNEDALSYTVDSHVHFTGPNSNFKVCMKASP